MTTILSGFIWFIYLDDSLGQQLIYAKTIQNANQQHNCRAKNGTELLFRTKNCKKKIRNTSHLFGTNMMIYFCDDAFVICFLFLPQIKVFAKPNFQNSMFQHVDQEMTKSKRDRVKKPTQTK